MQTLQGWAVGFAAYVAIYSAYLALLMAFLMTLEAAAPRPGPQPSLHSRVKAGVFWVVFFAVGGLLMDLLSPIMDRLVVKPLFPSLNPTFLPSWAALIVGGLFAAAVSDLFFYWAHRLQHTVPILWRFHATHHSVRELSAATGWHHVLESPIKAVIYGLPIGLITRDPFTLPVVGGLMGMLGHYLHSTTRLNFGPFNRVIVDNRFHRIHHSREAAHFDKNFGVITPIWDMLFGTAYFPRPDEWPETGLEDVPEPQSVLAYLAGPFRPPAALAHEPPVSSR